MIIRKKDAKIRLRVFHSSHVYYDRETFFLHIFETIFNIKTVKH